MKGYGMEGYGGDTRYDFTDTYPSLLMAASDYVQRQQGSCVAGEKLCRDQGLGHQDAGHGRGWRRVA